LRGGIGGQQPITLKTSKGGLFQPSLSMALVKAGGEPFKVAQIFCAGDPLS
jgi:hypothetical protein